MSEQVLTFGDVSSTTVTLQNCDQVITAGEAQTLISTTNQGPQGAAGDSVTSLEPRIQALEENTGGFGYQLYLHNGPNQIIDSTPQRLQINGLDSSSFSNLKPPFGASEILGNDSGAGFVISPRAEEDTYRLIIRLGITPGINNSTVTVDLNIGGVFGVIESESEGLILGADVLHTKTFSFAFYCGSTFTANGGQFWVHSTSEGEISFAEVRLFPGSIK